MDPIRRKILRTGVAATAMAAAPRVFAGETGQGGAATSFYEKGRVRIHYEEAGSGFPLLLIAGGGLNSTIAGLKNPFNVIEEFKGEYRCIAADLRNANSGQSSGPLEIDRPWDSHTISSAWCDGSPGHQQIPGAGFLHRWPVHLESVEAGAGSCRRRRAGAAQWVPAGDAHAFLRHQHDRLGTGIGQAPAGYPDGDGREISDEDVSDQPRLRLHGDARFRAQLPDSRPDSAGRYPRTSICGRDGGGDARAEGRSEHLPVEGAEGADSV